MVEVSLIPRHEFEQSFAGSEAWCAAAHRILRVGHNMTEQEQNSVLGASSLCTQYYYLQIKTVFIVFVSNLDTFISFCVLIAVVRASSIMLDISNECKYLCLVLELRELIFTITYEYDYRIFLLHALSD